MEPIGESLKRLGIPELIFAEDTDISSDAEAEDPSCPLCRGAGYLRRDLPVGHPEFGALVPCQCKLQELAQLRRESLWNLSNLGPLTRLTFENLVKKGRAADPASQDRFRRACALAQDFTSSPAGWLVLMGPSGCGKTHLAAAIANHQLSLGEPVCFMVVPDLLDHLRATFSPDNMLTYDELFENLRNTPLLILDDLGAQSSTPWAQEKLFQLFNHRYNHQLPTVVTTNRKLGDLEERLRSRLGDPAISRVCAVEEWPTATLQRFGRAPLEMLQTMTFDTFIPGGVGLAQEHEENLRRAWKLAQSFAENPDGWLVLTGTYGCGKTHLAAAIANHRTSQGQAAYFVVAPDLLDDLRASFSPESLVPRYELFEAIRTAPLLILDDLGAHNATPWAQEKLYQLINYRYNARLPTVITTSLPLESLEPRLATRMLDPKISEPFAILAPAFPLDLYRAAPRGRGRGGGRAPSATSASRGSR